MKVINDNNPQDAACLLWNDPCIKIDWPVKHPLLSEKDNKGLPLTELLPCAYC